MKYIHTRPSFKPVKSCEDLVLLHHKVSCAVYKVNFNKVHLVQIYSTRCLSIEEPNSGRVRNVTKLLVLYITFL